MGVGGDLGVVRGGGMGDLGIEDKFVLYIYLFPIYVFFFFQTVPAQLPAPAHPAIVGETTRYCLVQEMQ